MHALRRSFRTIDYFRKENAEAFKFAFRRFALLLKKIELIEGDTISIDSFKIFAQNNLKNNFNPQKIDRHIEYIDKKVEKYETQLNESDTEDRKGLLKKKIAEKLSHRKHYEELSEKLPESSEKQISLIDPNARNLQSSKNISGVSYNTQATADAKYKLLVHNHIGESTDKHELATTALSVQFVFGLTHFKTLSDAGYIPMINYTCVSKSGFPHILLLCQVYHLPTTVIHCFVSYTIRGKLLYISSRREDDHSCQLVASP